MYSFRVWWWDVWGLSIIELCLSFPQTLGTGRLEYFKHCPVSGSLRISEGSDFAHALQEQNGLEYFNLGSVTESLRLQNITCPE